MGTGYTPGMFVWRELATHDTAAAKAFYGTLFGWSTQAVDMGAFEYTLLLVGERQVGGLMPILPEMPPHAHWSSYVSVEDVDAAAARASAAGGQVVHGPHDIAGVGRIATTLDPQGAVLHLFRNAMTDPPEERMPPVGVFVWEHLSTSDLAAAKAYYGAVLGWSGGRGAQNSTDVFMVGEKYAASVNQSPAGAPSAWVTHVHVADVEASLALAASLGAKVLMPVMPVPGMGRTAVIADPQGAAIALFTADQGV
ncbi:MAG: VOC family protein [Myxococcales bacterium]|nr:VOC family protein [Myxococcales bacterium]